MNTKTQTQTPPNASAAAPARLAGLDGLRAIAVTLVLVYHFWPQALPGGFIGVDVFFVISGFLITTLLLAEYRSNGRIALGSFWRRRARRLLPALGLVLLVCTSGALLVGGDVLVNIAAQVFGAAFFVANWVYVALGADYFTRDNPELFRNTWSLAIEEQFYVLLPLVLLIALRMRGRATSTLLFAVAGLLSALWMTSLAAEGANATRVYFGTDSHLFGLLFGVSLACGLRPRGASPAAIPGRLQQLGTSAAGLLGLAVLGALALTLREGSPQSFAWGFQLASAAALTAVWAVTREGSRLGRRLDSPPLRWIGERSYGIYLWHWPVLLLLTPSASRMGLPDGAVPLLALSITVLFAAVSYRYVEQPVRAVGLHRAIRRLCHPRQLSGRGIAAAASLATVLALTVPATAIAIATAPAQSGSAAAISRGQEALETMNAARRDTPQASKRPGTIERKLEGSARSEHEPGHPEDFNPNWTQNPEFEALAPKPYEGSEIFAVGDSVMLASAPELGAAFPDIWIDAGVSRSLSFGVDIVAEIEAAGGLRPVIVAGLGTNGPIDRDDLERLREVADGRPIVLVNAYGDRPWIPGVNEQLRAFADAHRGISLADWESAIAAAPGGLYEDEIHPNESGGRAYAAALRSALDALLEKDERPKHHGRVERPER